MSESYLLLAPLVAMGVTAMALASWREDAEFQTETAPAPIVPESPVAVAEPNDVWMLRA